MPRTRVHNLNISLDGYAAGDHVTFDAPIGGAERLFTWFDGRAIHGGDKGDAPLTLDRALTRMWGQGIGAEIDRKSTRLNSRHSQNSYAVFCLKKKKEL